MPGHLSREKARPYLNQLKSVKTVTELSTLVEEGLLSIRKDCQVSLFSGWLQRLDTV